MSGSETFWGQPAGEYQRIPTTIFAMSVKIPLRFSAGFKVHISADLSQADRVARLALPTLRIIFLHHKVVCTLPEYQRMNGGNQRGKFITIYPGPVSQADRILSVVDRALAGHGFRPGPAVLSRRSGHTEAEIKIGDSGMVYTFYADGYSE